MLENDVSDLHQTFRSFKKFIKNGRNILVTESNKKDYVKALCLAKMSKEIRAQTYTLMKGIQEIIPYDLMNLLTANELGIVLSGITKIDGFFHLCVIFMVFFVVNDMRKTAILSGFKKNDEVMEWLWEIMEEYTDVERASFHFFVTGLEKIILKFK